jgi:hypothetical protein
MEKSKTTENNLPLLIQENSSINFEEVSRRYVVKRDGTQVVYDPTILSEYLNHCLKDLSVEN